MRGYLNPSPKQPPNIAFYCTILQMLLITPGAASTLRAELSHGKARRCSLHQRWRGTHTLWAGLRVQMPFHAVLPTLTKTTDQEIRSSEGSKLLRGHQAHGGDFSLQLSSSSMSSLAGPPPSRPAHKQGRKEICHPPRVRGTSETPEFQICAWLQLLPQSNPQVSPAFPHGKQDVALLHKTKILRKTFSSSL